MATTATPQGEVWDDCSVISPTALNPTGPDGAMTVIADAAGYMGALLSDAVGESCTVYWQLNHQYVPGSDIHPHIHIVRCDGADNTGNCEFEANFRRIPLKGTASAWSGNVAGATANQPADGADQSGIITWSLAFGTYNFSISSIIACVIRRSGVTTGGLALTSADVHAKKGRFGTVNEGDTVAG